MLRGHADKLRVVPAGEVAEFSGDPAAFKLGMEALRIQMAAQFDPMLAVATSDLEPLPHQIQAVYGDLLGRDQPLRFLLADDPGAGKTIMAGLYVKELTLRGDLQRCLIVVPGGLVDQWQDELHDKFGLRFEILTGDLIAATPPSENVFAEHPRLIARMDQVARSDMLTELLAATEWDVVVVDEAHRMAAHYFGAELKVTKRYELGRLLGGITRHLLLMTATPHAGKEEDFQLFLALLDPDRFEGRYRKDVHALDTEGVMRRRVKEELLTFDGTPLFPKRRATTLPYRLSVAEMELYEAVTRYVKSEMGRADQLREAGEGRRGNTVGFALTVLQRRLASSPSRPSVTSGTESKDAGPVRLCRFVGFTGTVFVADETRLAVTFPVVYARLVNLTRGSSLVSAADDAIGDGYTGLARVGPAGPAPGVSRLVTVSFLDPVMTGETAVLGLRWTATGPGGRLFPALDANITLTADGEQATWLRLAGAYRPPLGALGARVDAVIMNRVAAATMRSFVRRVAEAIVHPAAATEPGYQAEGAEPYWPPPQPETP